MTPASSSRNVLVTGGTGGIGRYIARAFADDGDNVAISSRDGRVEGDWLALGVRLNLEEPAAAAASVDKAIRELGGLDTLVVNAVRWPTQTTTRFEDLPAEEWRVVLRANIEGAFAVIQAALPALRASGRGRIVLISSGAAEEGHPVSPHYVAAKAAVMS